MKSFLALALVLFLRVDGFGETYILGRIDLAGFPSETLPACDSPLRIEAETCAPSSSIAVWDAQRILGHIPARHEEAIREMLRRGVHLELRIVRHHQPPAPGQYVEVEIRAISPDIRLLIPLLEAEPEEIEVPDEEWEG